MWYKTNINTGIDCCHDLSELRCAWQLKPLLQFLYKVQFRWNFVPSGYSAIKHFYKMMQSAYLSLCCAYLPHHICHGWQHKPYQYIRSNKWYVLYTHFIHQYASVQHKCPLLRIFSLCNFMQRHDFAHLVGLAPRGSSSLDMTHACRFCNACAQAIVSDCYLIRWKILLRIQLFQFYVLMFQVTIKLTVSNLNDYLSQHFYEVVDDILFILDVPKLYHYFAPHSTNHNYPHHIINLEASSYSKKKRKHGNCKLSLHHVRSHCQKLKPCKPLTRIWDSPHQLGGGGKPLTSASKAQLQPFLSSSINLDTMENSSFTFVAYVPETDIDLYLKQDCKRISCNMPIHIICEFLSVSDIRKLALSHLGQHLPSKLKREGCINALQGHCCHLCQTHRAIFSPNFHDEIKKQAKKNSK